jgi:hypothetical protein
VNRSSVILTQEMVKFAMACFMLIMSGGRKTAFEGACIRIDIHYHGTFSISACSVTVSPLLTLYSSTNQNSTQAGRFPLGYRWQAFLPDSTPFKISPPYWRIKTWMLSPSMY